MTESVPCVTDGFVMRPLVLLLLLLFGCSQGGPLPEMVDGTRGLEVRSFEGEDLFDYMDGGAELYYEYGFRRLWVRDYRSEGEELRAELYEMEDPEGAFGLLTAEAVGEEVEVGQEGFYEDGTLVFWKGSYFVRVSAEGDLREEVLKLGRAIASRLKGGGSPPQLIGYLPRGVRAFLYFRGPLALHNFYFLSHEDLLRLGEGAEGVAYRARGGVVVLVSYPVPSEARRALEGLHGFLEEARVKGGVVIGRSRRGWAGGRAEEGLLLIVLDFPSLDEVKGFLETFPLGGGKR